MIRCRPGPPLVAARAEGVGPAAAASVVAVVGCVLGDELACRAG